MLATLLLALPAAPAFVLDAADDQYHFIVGLADKGMHEMVVKEAETFLAEHPEHAKADLARYRLGIALFELGRLSEARPQFERLVTREGFEFRSEALFRLGQCALEAGDDAAAATSFEAVVRAGTPYLLTPANFLLGEARFRAGEFEAAQGAYARALAADDAGGFAADSAHGLAWCAFRLERYDDAIRRVQDFLQRFPHDERTPELRFLAGECHLEAGRPGPALSAYRSVEGGPFHDAALRGAGFACAAAGDHAAAADWFGRLLEEHPDSRYVSEAALHRGIHLLQAGQAATAARALAGDGVERGPESSYWLGRALADSGEGELALAALDAGLEDGSADEELRTRLLEARGDVLFELGRADDAAHAFESAGSAYALHAAAVARLNQGEHEEAVRLARAVLAQGDGAYALEAQLTLGEGLLALGETAAAEEAFAAVLGAQEPARRSHALTRIGWCRYLAGEPAEAAQRFAEVGRTFPDGPDAEEALFMEARSREDAGETQAAAGTYASYIQRFPGGTHFDEALLRVARLETGPEGEARLARLLDEAPDSQLAAQAHFDLAERLVESGRTEPAEPHYRAVLEDHPEDPLAPAAAYGLAWCRSVAGDHEAAVRLLQPVAADADADPGVRASALELLVWARQRVGDADGAREAYRALAELVDDEPRRFRAARAAAQALADAGRGDEASELYAELLRVSEDPDVALGILVERAYLALDAGAVDEAEAHVRAALRYRPDDRELVEAVFFVGEARFAAGDDARAAELYDAAAVPAAAPAAEAAAGEEGPPIGERALYKGGFARLRAEDLDGAAERFARLVEEHPRSELLGEALFLLGEANYRAGHYAEAIPPLQRVRAEAPQHEVRPKALFRLGLALARTERWREAGEVLAELVQAYPDFANATEAELWRGRALAALGERRAARAAFQRVVEGDRGVLSAQARIELGRLALSAGERDDALSEFLKVAVLYAHPEEVAEALYMAGQILETMGDGERAIAQYREILETYPDARFARPAQERLRDLEP